MLSSMTTAKPLTQYIPHRLLLDKLKLLDANGHNLHWIVDYFRTQRVVVNGDQSDTEHVVSGVPQGFVLGPLLFLIHIDRIHSISLSPNSHMTIYADDICVYSPICFSADFRNVQSDIIAVEEWSAANFLSLNLSKTNYMIISRKKAPSNLVTPLMLGNYPLNKVNSFKYLTVLLSHNLSWSPHVESIGSKARRVLGLLFSKFYG